MELEGNVDLPVVDAEGKEAPQVDDIDDPNIPPYPHPLESETAAEAAL